MVGATYNRAINLRFPDMDTVTAAPKSPVAIPREIRVRLNRKPGT